MHLMPAVLALLAAALGRDTNPLLSLAAPARPKYLMVATSVSAPAVTRDGVAVTLFADIVPDRGMHVYAPGAKDYLPIALTIAPAKNVRVGKLTYPMPEIYFFEVLNER